LPGRYSSIQQDREVSDLLGYLVDDDRDRRGHAELDRDVEGDGDDDPVGEVVDPVAEQEERSDGGAQVLVLFVAALLVRGQLLMVAPDEQLLEEESRCPRGRREHILRRCAPDCSGRKAENAAPRRVRSRSR
jgi:hypothetical protein